MTSTIHEIEAFFPWFFPGVVFVFGACVGSFLNVVILRLPAGRSVVLPGSRCACGKPLAWYDNIPILSWIILRGKARCCGRLFSVRYPMVELLTAGLFLAAWFSYPPVLALVVMGFIAWMIAPSFIDLDTMEIPDIFSIGGFVLGLLCALLVPALHGFDGDFWIVDAFRSETAAVQGAFIGSGLILWVALIAETLLRKEAMGFGDVKLMGAIGAFCGWQGAVFALFGGAILGCLGFLFAALIKIFRPATPEAAAGKTAAPAQPVDAAEAGEDAEIEGVRVPFGPALAGAAVLYLLWLHPFVDAYFATISDVLFP